MKKRILSIITAFLIINTFNSQTVNDHKVNVNYIQLPSQPLPSSISTYSILVAKKYEQANEDSIAVYNNRIEAAKTEQEALLLTWNMERKRIDKLYYAQMATWQKALNAGSTTAAKPNDPKYPEYPFIKDVEMPILTEDIQESTVSNSIDIKGYNKGEGGAVLIFTFDGIQNVRMSNSKTGSAASTKYHCKAHFKMPISVKMEVEGQGVLYEKTFYTNEVTKLIKSEKSEYDIKIWWLDNSENYWKNIQASMVNSAISSVNSEIVEKFGFPKKVSSTEIYVIKKYKDHNYGEFVDALSYVKSGYDLIHTDVEKVNAKVKINQGVAVWLELLEESNPDDNKSRINKKATALLYANLAEAYLWMDDFDNADLYANKGRTIGVLKYKSHCKKVQDKIGMLKSRYIANQ